MAEGTFQLPPDDTGKVMRTQTNAGVAGGAHQQVVTIGDADGTIGAVAKDGTDITAPTAMPAGGAGIRGWLSAIWTKLNGTLAVSIAATVTVDSELTTQDFDSGAGTVNAAVTGVVVPAAGGPVAVTGDAANGLDVDVTRLPSLAPGTAYVGKVRDTDGTNDITYKTLPAGGTGQTAKPVWINAHQLPTFTLVGDNIVTGALVANTRKDILSIDHAVGATKTIKIRKITIGGFQTTTLVGVVYAKVFTGVLQASAGTAVTPNPVVLGTAAAEATCRSLPTITAAVLKVSNAVGFCSAATAQTGFPVATLYEWEEGSDMQPITLKAATLEGLAVAVYSNVAHNLTLQVTVTFTEE